MNDHISNFITKIKNANGQGHTHITVADTKMNAAVAAALLKGGWIGAISKKVQKEKNHSLNVLEIALAYNADETPKVTGAKRVSKSSKRVYTGYKDLRSVRNGYGILLLTTPAGVMSEVDARKQKVGGEPLFMMW